MAHELDDTTPLTWSPLKAADLPELSDLQSAIEYIDDPLDRHTLSELEGYYNEPGADADNLTLAGRERGGSMVAWGWNRHHVGQCRPAQMWLRGGVHPAWRNQNIGRQLIAWQQHQARAWFAATHDCDDGPLRMIGHAEQRLAGRCQLYEFAGMTARRYFVDMVRDDLADLPELPTVDGIWLCALDHDRFEDCRLAHNEVFGSVFGSQPVSEEQWRKSLSRDSARSDLSRVAVDDSGRIVGYAVCGTFTGEHGLSYGWIERFGVRPAWRSRGVATAMLVDVLHAFHAAGLQRAGIGVDGEGPVVSLGVYERLGYRATDTMIMFARDEN